MPTRAGPPTRLEFELGLMRTVDGTVVSVSGELDISTAPRLREFLAMLVDDDARVVVDLSELTFIDSSGLGVLVGARARAANDGRQLLLRSPSRTVRRALEVSGLDQVLPIL